AALLDPEALFVPDRDPAAAGIIPPLQSHLQISAAFAFFQRERRATDLMEDLKRLRSAVHEDDALPDLPEAVAALVTEPADTVEEPDYPQFRGVSTIPGVASSTEGAHDLFFPKPYNREQVEIVQRL